MPLWFHTLQVHRDSDQCAKPKQWICWKNVFDMEFIPHICSWMISHTVCIYTQMLIHYLLRHPKILCHPKMWLKQPGFFINHTVNGRNPAPVDMVNIPVFTWFYIHPRWLFGISSINSFNPLIFVEITGRFFGIWVPNLLRVRGRTGGQRGSSIPW